jgi:hypothetical protein
MRLKVSVSALLLTTAAGCGVDQTDDTGDKCGPNSSYSDEHGHCHCDEGFSIQGTACLPEDEGDEGGGAPQPLDLTSAEVTGQSLEQDGQPIFIVQAVAGDAVLRIEGYVAFGAPEGPSHVALTGPELNYATCSVCVVVQTGCAAHDDHFHCDETFMPTGGAVDFTALDPRANAAGAVHDLVFQPVTIADDFTSSPAPGTPLSLAHWEFDTGLTAPN